MAHASNTPPLPLPPPHLVPKDIKLKYQKLICDLTGWRNEIAFPGAQPVSFERKHLQTLQDQKYYACEKTDGVRFMMLIMQGATYMVDRNFDLYQVQMFCPRHDNPLVQQDKTLLDGELVCDDLGNGKWEWRYLVYDMVAVNARVVCSEPLNDRLKHVRNYVLTPREKTPSPSPSATAKPEPFKMMIKEFFEVRHVRYIFDTVIPALKHHNDGIIFTKVSQPYINGTDHTLLKWKPASMNTVDFQLDVVWRRRVARFRLLVSDKRTAKPFDWITFDDEMKEEVYKSPSVWSGKIIECVYDPTWPTTVYSSSEDKSWDEDGRVEAGGWKFMRVRTDKNTANDISVVNRIRQSFNDNVSPEQLLVVSEKLAADYNLQRPQPQPPPVKEQEQDNGLEPPAKRHQPNGYTPALALALQPQPPSASEQQKPFPSPSASSSGSDIPTFDAVAVSRGSATYGRDEPSPTAQDAHPFPFPSFNHTANPSSAHPPPAAISYSYNDNEDEDEGRERSYQPQPARPHFKLSEESDLDVEEEEEKAQEESAGKQDWEDADENEDWGD